VGICTLISSGFYSAVRREREALNLWRRIEIMSLCITTAGALYGDQTRHACAQFCTVARNLQPQKCDRDSSGRRAKLRVHLMNELAGFMKAA